MKLLKEFIIILLVLFFAFGVGTKAVFSENFPTKHVTIICGYSPGGSTDMQIRGIIPYLQKRLDKGVIVENRTGATGILASNEVFSAEPDGYTLLVASIPTIIISEKLLPSTAKYDAKKYSHIFGFAREELILVANPDMYKSFQEFAKAGSVKKLKVGTSGKGTNTHLSAVMLELVTKVKLNIIPFEGGAESMASLAGNHIDGVITLSSSGISMTRSGVLKPLLILGDSRHAGYPGVPSAKELGYDVSTLVPYFTGVFGPPNMPEERNKILENAFADAVQTPDYLKWAKNLNLNIVSLPSKVFLKETLKGYPAADKYMEVLKKL